MFNEKAKRQIDVVSSDARVTRSFYKIKQNLGLAGNPSLSKLRLF